MSAVVVVLCSRGLCRSTISILSELGSKLIDSCWHMAARQMRFKPVLASKV